MLARTVRQTGLRKTTGESKKCHSERPAGAKNLYVTSSENGPEAGRGNGRLRLLSERFFTDRASRFFVARVRSLLKNDNRGVTRHLQVKYLLRVFQSPPKPGSDAKRVPGLGPPVLGHDEARSSGYIQNGTGAAGAPHLCGLWILATHCIYPEAPPPHSIEMGSTSTSTFAPDGPLSSSDASSSSSCSGPEPGDFIIT